MSKAMVITLPFLLLLLDLWPLRRVNRSNFRGIIQEKAPFFGLTLFFCALTFWFQAKQGAVMAFKELGVLPRFENATLSYLYYLWQFIWPANLAFLYPRPRNFDGMEVLLTALLLGAVSVLCILQIRRRPYLAAGWFWYLITLVPVIGLIQVGEASMADRYTYLPLIGPVFTLVWLVCEGGRGNGMQTFLPAITAAILAGCILLTRRQISYWHNTVSLFSRAAETTAENGLAEFPLAQGLEYQGKFRQAAVHYRMAIVMEPATFHYLANLNFGRLLNNMGYSRAAAERLEAAIQLNPDSSLALNELAWTLATSPDATFRDGPRAVKLAERACELTNYQFTLFVGTLAAAYAENGEFDDAITTAQNAILLAQQQGQGALAEKNQELLNIYAAHKAYHEKGQ